MVPALRHAKVGKKRKASSSNSSDPDEQEEYIDGVAVATKLNKATILKKATDYIHHLKYTNDQLQQENVLLQQCLQRLPGGSSAFTQFQAYKLHQQQQQQQQPTSTTTLPFATSSSSSSSSSPSVSTTTTTTTTFMALFLCMSFSLPGSQSDNHTATSTVPSDGGGGGGGLSVMRLLLLTLIGLFLLFPHHSHKHKEHSKYTDTLPQRFLPWHVFLQVLRLVIRHMVSVDIHSTTPSQEPSWLDTWIHNDDDDHDDGDDHASHISNNNNKKESQLARVYACVRMINLAETMDAVDMVQVYATAALRIDPVSRWVARYLWRLAMYEMTEDHPLHSLTWDVHHQADDDAMLDTMLDSQAWAETLAHTQPTLQRLASLHLLDNLRTEFARLVISITSPPTSTTTHPFHPLLMAATSLSSSTTATTTWLAAVGVAVEALWRSDATQAQEAIALVQKTARTTLGHKMVHMLSGALAMIDDGEQHQDDTETAVQRLLEAEATQQYMKRVVRRRRVQGLDSEVLALAEFVVCLAGLQAWIDVWRHHAWAASHVKDLSLTLRRMMRCSSLEKLPTHQVLVDRLSRLGYFAGHPVDDEEEDDDVDEQQLDCHADKAIAILHGLI